MPVFDDIVTDVFNQSGKTGAELKSIVQRTAERVVREINHRMKSEVLKRRKTLTATANDRSVELPAEVERVIELGLYDAATERISTPFVEIDERAFNARYAGGATPASGIGPYREWFFIDRTATNLKQIRLDPLQTTTITLLVRYYCALTPQLVDTMENPQMIAAGVIGYMPGWFPNSWGLNRQEYDRAIERMKLEHGSVNKSVIQGQPAELRAANAYAATLVQ